MENSAAAVAAIPPASYVVKHLNLKSRLPRRDGDVTVCTQCSLERLERLEAQTRSWSGVICAAVMCPCPCVAASLRAAKQCIRDIHARVEARGGPCRLDIILVAHSRRRDQLLLGCRDPWQYPINALRNVALHSAATELVILLDVDFLLGVGIQEQLWKPDVYTGYLRACINFRRVVVLPALEETVDPETSNLESSSVDNDCLERALHIVTAGKVNTVKQWTQGKLRAFAADEYPPGHGPTDTKRWVESFATYEVLYEAGYEPFFLCARHLVPWYDERFTGYGKNKVIHAFHIAVLDFRFWVHPEWYVLHVPHWDSIAKQATLGNDPLASQRFSDVKLLYARVKHELVSLPSHSGVFLSPGICAHEVCFIQFPTNISCFGQMRQGKRAEEEQMGHWSCADRLSPLLLQTSSKEYLQALYDLRYHFCVPKLRPVLGAWPLHSKLPRKPKDISLVTVATSDRLQRLLAQCRQWKGVICAAIYAPRNANAKALAKQVIELHREVEKAGMCRLDLILLESADITNGNCCCREPIIDPSCQACGSRGKPTNELCPINALRNAALGLATTDLILLLDVDLLPAPSLNDCFLDEQQYKCLWQMAVEERTAVVVPSFEYVGVIEDDDFVAGKFDDCPPQQVIGSSLGSEMGNVLKITEKESKFDEERYISDAEKMTGQGVHAIHQGLSMGRLCGFHEKHYAAGHGPTDFEKWRSYSEIDDRRSRPCCDVCQSYTVTFAEGFEPFIICSRKLIPRFDERFRGYGYDKVTFFYHLHLMGFGFRVLVHSFALDIPHPKSPDWMKTFGPDSDPLQHIRLKALYQRAKRELCLVTGLSAVLANEITQQLPASLGENSKQTSGYPPRSYEELHIPNFPGGRHNRPTLEGLQLTWQGVIRCLGSHHGISSDCHQGESSSCDRENLETSVGKGRAELSQTNFVSKPTSLLSKDDETTDHSKQTPAVRSENSHFSRCFGLESLWAHRIASTKHKSSPSDSPDWANALEEFEWESIGWELKCSADSLANCSVVKAFRNECVSNGETFHNGGYWLRISMSSGSWSPQASRLAGITTGGVSVRSLLPIRAVKAVVVRYMVRFPSCFVWVKGGTLPGLWVHDILQTNFGWRRAGEGHLSLNLTGKSFTASEQQATSSTRRTRMVSRPFYFVPGQWHALQLALSVVDQAGTCDQDTGVDSKKAVDNSSSFSHRLNFESILDGAVVEIQAFFDFELVSKKTLQPCKRNLSNLTRNGEEPGAAMGLLLSCYFGGKTQEWATRDDTHIDFTQVIMLLNNLVKLFILLGMQNVFNVVSLRFGLTNAAKTKIHGEIRSEQRCSTIFERLITIATIPPFRSLLL